MRGNTEFVGYRKLAGTSLQALPLPLSPPRRARLARQLGEFLSVLHAVDPRTLRVALPQADSAILSEPLGDAARNVEALATVDTRLQRRVERWLLDADPAAVPPQPEVVAHGDLDVEHILLEHRSDAPAAIIDWGNAGLAPPVTDFVGLYGFGGIRFLEQVLASYDGSFGAVHLRWLVRRQVCVALRNVAYGQAARQPAFVSAALRGLGHALA